MDIRVLNLGPVNAYLLITEAGFLLVDTGSSDQRAALERELIAAGCQPGNLNLVVATHGDSDHVGNCAWLRQKYAAKIAMHRDEVEAVESGDPLLNKKVPHNISGMPVRIILLLFKLKPADRFTPDFLLEDGDDLSGHGLDARVLHIPGHSNGSIGVLAPDGKFICGDFLSNYRRPAPGLGIFDHVEFETSLEKLKRLNIRWVYPGHGKPFVWESFVKQYGENYEIKS